MIQSNENLAEDQNIEDSKNIGDKNIMLSSGIPEFDNDVVRPTVPVLL